MKTLGLFFFSILAFASNPTEKEQLETRVLERVHTSLAPFLQPKEYIVNVTVNTNPEEELEIPSADSQGDSLVALSKIGMQIDRNMVLNRFFKEKKSFFDEVQSIDIVLSIPDTARAKLEGDIRPVVNRVMKAYAPIPFNIDISRFNAIKPPPPEPPPVKVKTPLDYLETFQIPISMIVVSLLLFLLLVVYMRKFGKLEGEKLEVMRTQSASTSVGAAAPAASAGAPSAGPAVSGGGATVAAGGGAVATVAAGGAAVVGGAPSVVTAGGGGSSTITASAMPPEQMERYRGFKQFESMLESAPYKAARLVKEWVNLKSYDALLALSVVPQHFGVEKIAPLLNVLDQDIRAEWKDCIQRNLPENAYMIVNQYILSQTVEDVLVPPEPMADELKGMLLDITPEEAAELAKGNARYGAVFANLFEPARVARMFSEMDPETVRLVSESSLSFTVGQAAELRDEMKNAIEEVRTNREGKKTFFLQKSIDLIREVGPEKETEIYQALAQAGEMDTMRKAAELYTPASLIDSLPDELLKQRLSQMPLAERATLIASLDTELQDKFLNSFGSEGKLRELITVQLEQIKSDELMMRKISRQKSKLWKDFIETTRTLISSSDDWKDQIEPAIENWVERFASGGQKSVS